MKRVTIAVSMAVGLLPLLMGCGDSQKKTVYKASGVATYSDDNTPLKNVRLTFTPTAGVTEGDSLPHADTDDNGKFEISTYGDKDGCPAGEYKVSVAPPVSTLKPPGPGEKPDAMPSPGKMPMMQVDVATKFLSANTTTATVKIEASATSNTGLQVKVEHAKKAGS